MKTAGALIAARGTCLVSIQLAPDDEPSAFGSGFDVQEFDKPFTANDITPANMQKWSDYK